MLDEKTNVNLVNNSNQNENLINKDDSLLFERLDKKQKLEIKDYIWNSVKYVLEEGINEMKSSCVFREYLENQFPHIKEGEINKEIDKYTFELKMDNKTIENSEFWE